MIETFDGEQLELILASKGGPHVSVVLAPPAKAMDAQEDAVRVVNLLRHAYATLCDGWMESSAAADLLRPLFDLSNDSRFLAPRRHGVAIYLSDDLVKIYQATEAVEERLVIAETFAVRHMLPSVDEFAPFFVLTLSKKNVALYDATLRTIPEIEDVDLPPSFEQSMSDVTADYGAQLHSAATRSTGKQAAVFHGHGGKPDTVKSELIEYFRRVNSAICSHLQRRSGFLIFAGVDYLTAIYAQVNSYKNVAAGTVSGNVDHLPADLLLDLARPIAIEVLQNERETAADRIRQRRRDLIVTDAQQVLCAAHDGRIGTLFFDKTAKLNGSFYRDTRILKEMHHDPTGAPDDPVHDLIEMAVVQTFRHRGHVYAVTTDEMPIEARMAAILRF